MDRRPVLPTIIPGPQDRPLMQPTQPMFAAPAPPPEDGVPWGRYFAAVKRYRWLVIAVFVLGSAGGFAATRLVAPEYETQAAIWIQSETPQARGAGPIRASELMNSTAWPQLLQSYSVLDRVVKRVRLYVVPAAPSERVHFAGLQLGEKFRVGKYQLKVEGTTYTLSSAENDVIEQGTVGDSIGRGLGFLWAPTAAELGAPRLLKFSIIHPRAAAVSLHGRVRPTLPANSSLMRVVLSGDDPELLAETLNALVVEYVAVAADLKTRNLVEFTRALQEQVDYAERELNAAEMAVEAFRVNTITLPAEGGPVAAGTEVTRNPVFANFFEEKIALENVKRDRAALERAMAEVQAGGSLNPLWAIPSVQTFGRDFTTALNEHMAKETVLRTLQQTFTDAHQPVIDQQRVVDEHRTQRIVPLGVTLAGELRTREADLEARIAGASRELQAIPTRAIEEMKLERNRQARENLFITLKNRFEEARLAQRSSLPDVTPLDPAVAPNAPVRSTAERILLMAVVGSLGAALLLAILLDRLDRRFRYPEQATTELRLPILGAVPKIPKNLDASSSADEVVQVLESFRSVRLAMSHALDGFGPKMVTITSPGMGDGKSLVSANLAMAFASAGYRTILIDGDTRRGALHDVFGLPRTPGLLDVLSGAATLGTAVRPAGPEHLSFLPSGRRSKRGPELLQSAMLARILEALRAQYDAVIIDSPPLSAGVDAFVLAAATGSVALVLRTGTTDRKLAKAKLDLIDRIPTNVIGAVLNDVRTEGMYRYYSYLEGYEPADEPIEVGAGSGQFPVRT